MSRDLILKTTRKNWARGAARDAAGQPTSRGRKPDPFGDVSLPKMLRKSSPFVSGQTEICGSFASDESRAQGEDDSGSSLSHPEYRALVVREARRASGNPSARDFYRAQKRVDASLGRAGRSISIPGARPGRRTI